MSWLYALPMLGIVALSVIDPGAGATVMLMLLVIFFAWLAIERCGALMRWLTRRRP